MENRNDIEIVEDIKKADVPRVEITTTVGCRVNCKFCPQKDFITSYQKDSKEYCMSFDTFSRCIDKLPEECEIVFGGFSECFLNDECTKMIQYAAQKHQVLLYTTLVGVKEEEVDTILSVPYRKCIIHIPDSEGYADIPVNDTYIRILDKFLSAKKQGGGYVVGHLSCQGIPHPDIEKMIEGFFVLNYLENRCGLVSGENVVEATYLKGSIICRHCGITMINHNMLLPDGRLALCANDWTLKHILGNLLEQSYEQIMNGTVRRDLREKMLLEEDNDILCRKCIHAKRIEDLVIDTWQTEQKKGNLN